MLSLSAITSWSILPKILIFEIFAFYGNFLSFYKFVGFQISLRIWIALSKLNANMYVIRGLSCVFQMLFTVKHCNAATTLRKLWTFYDQYVITKTQNRPQIMLDNQSDLQCIIGDSCLVYD